MKNVYVKKDALSEALSYINGDITFYGFMSHVKNFLKQLLTSPLSADIDSYLKDNNLNRKELLDLLIKNNIVNKETKIEDKGINESKDKFTVRYKIPKKNFERKMKRLFASLFEKNEILSNELNEDGATSCGSAMQGGGLSPDSGQYTTPIGKVQRRKIYITNEQSEMLKEMATHDAGNYQYDVPFKFNGGKGPAYNHKNMMAKSFQNKKKGVRNKKK